MMAFEIAFGIMAVLSAALAVICFKLWRANAEMVRTNARLEAESNARRESLPTEFENLATKALEKQTETFKNTATEPMEKIVTALAGKIDEMGKQNADNKGSFDTNMQNMMKVNEELARKTGSLSEVLRNSQKRGRYAEVGLERVFEMSKLTKGIHYTTQVRRDGTQPDFVVTLSKDRSMIVDSKAPLDALWDAYGTDNEAARADAMDKHAKAVRGHIKDLTKKDYSGKMNASMDYVVMVMPEYALLPALERDEQLIEYALENKVILVTPSTLMILLTAVNLMWKQSEMTNTVKEIVLLSATLYKRLHTFAQHHEKVGEGLDNAIKSYNSSISSWSSRILPAATKLANAGMATKDIPELGSIDTVSKKIPVDGDRDKAQR